MVVADRPSSLSLLNDQQYERVLELVPFFEAEYGLSFEEACEQLARVR